MRARCRFQALSRSRAVIAPGLPPPAPQHLFGEVRPVARSAGLLPPGLHHRMNGWFGIACHASEWRRWARSGRLRNVGFRDRTVESCRSFGMGLADLFRPLSPVGIGRNAPIPVEKVAVAAGLKPDLVVLGRRRALPAPNAAPHHPATL